MNKGSRYRRNRRKRRIKSIAIISISALIILFVIFMVVGLSLSKKPKPSDGGDFSNQQTAVSDQKLPVTSVNAYPLPLLEDGSSFASRLSDVNDSATSVCISLNRPNGELLFKSSVASHFSSLLVKSDASSISRSVELIKDDDLYLTALLYMTNPSNATTELVDDVYSSVWSAIACEVISEGVDDVLLIPSDSFDNVDKLCAIADSVHLTNEDAIIGLAIPKSILDSEDSVNLIAQLAKAFNFLAVDLTELDLNSELSLAERIEEEIKELQLQIMYHNMRVILPKGASSEEQSSLIESIKKYNINNWQISPN